MKIGDEAKNKMKEIRNEGSCKAVSEKKVSYRYPVICKTKVER